MKRSTILLLLSIAFILKLEAQFSIGVSGGINLANTRFTDTQFFDPEMTMYYFAGITPGFKFNDKLSINTDIQYSQKGFLDHSPLNPANSKFRFSYLDFLPQVEYRVHKNISIGAGGYVGFKSAEHSKAPDSDWTTNEYFKFAESMDYGLVASLKYHISKFHLLARLNYGLKDISELSFTDVNGSTVESVDLRNDVIQLGVGYTLK